MYKGYWTCLVVMVFLTPLGIIAKGSAWGEWGAEDLATMLGYIPQGIERAGEWWQAIFPEYAVSFLGDGSMADAGGYVFSAAVGSGLVYIVVMIIGRLVATKNCEL